MGELLSKISQKIEAKASRKEINKQVTLLKQMIIPAGETSSPNCLFDFQLDNSAVLHYSQGKDFDSFSLNYKIDKNNYSGPVIGLKIEKDQKVSFSSLAHVFETKLESLFRSEEGYLSDGSRYSGSVSQVFEEEAEFLSEKGAPILKATDPNPFPDQIRVNQAALNVLRLMNCKKTDFGVYIQAVQAAQA